jgi:hypothetical protein
MTGVHKGVHDDRSPQWLTTTVCHPIIQAVTISAGMPRANVAARPRVGRKQDEPSW